MAFNKINRDIFKQGFWYEYKDAMRYFSGPEDSLENVYPTLVPNWDHSPRTGKYGSILKNSCKASSCQQSINSLELGMSWGEKIRKNGLPSTVT